MPLMKNLPREPLDTQTKWGSDAIAKVLRNLGIEYIALNPGASFRALHDSVVNHLGNQGPHILLCLHEEHAVAIAHGFAKVTARPMAVALHTNVGLMHASMAIYNAFCDRVPVLVLGANGPSDASLRRPWIDWLHTVADPADLVRGFVKWDDYPGSIPALEQSLIRAHWLGRVAPAGPVFIGLDVALQEEQLHEDLPLYGTPREVCDPVVPDDAVRNIAVGLERAERPVILIGRSPRSRIAWDERVALVERVGARVVTDLKNGATFPNRHPLHAGFPGLSLSREARSVIRHADFILSLDSVDLSGSLEQAGISEDWSGCIVSVSLDPYVHNGWTKAHQAFAADATHLLGDPVKVVRLLLDLLEPTQSTLSPEQNRSEEEARMPIRFDSLQSRDERPLAIRDCATLMERALGASDPPCFIRLPIGWPGELLDFRDPLDCLGGDGGAGIGSGPGMAVGAALALRDLPRLPVAVLGDGDFLMGCTALWTAVSEEISLLVLVMNNRSYLNDELHQLRLARERGRSQGNRWVGQQIDDPPIDIAAIAKAQGAVGYGPVTTMHEFLDIVPAAVHEVERGQVAVVDILVRSEFDSETITQQLTLDAR